MYSLQNNPILTLYQIEILKSFFANPISRTFFLTGGTALSAFYLAHRESKDLDLFSIEPFEEDTVEQSISQIAKEMGCVLSTKVKTHTYNEMYIENKKDGWIQRIDVVREQPKRFGDVVIIDGVRVDALENIGSNKILAIFGRLEVKDYIDLYAILTQTTQAFDVLFELAKQKDTGLNEFYFANSLADIQKITNWPKLHDVLKKEKIVAYYKNLVETLLLRVKPQ